MNFKQHHQSYSGHFLFEESVFQLVSQEGSFEHALRFPGIEFVCESEGKKSAPSSHVPQVSNQYAFTFAFQQEVIFTKVKDLKVEVKIYHIQKSDVGTARRTTHTFRTDKYPVAPKGCFFRRLDDQLFIVILDIKGAVYVRLLNQDNHYETQVLYGADFQIRIPDFIWHLDKKADALYDNTLVLALTDDLLAFVVLPFDRCTLLLTHPLVVLHTEAAITPLAIDHYHSFPLRRSDKTLFQKVSSSIFSTAAHPKSSVLSISPLNEHFSLVLMLDSHLYLVHHDLTTLRFHQHTLSKLNLPDLHDVDLTLYKYSPALFDAYVQEKDVLGTGTLIAKSDRVCYVYLLKISLNVCSN